MPIVVSIYEERPSGYALTGGLGRVRHKETISCPHATEHVKLYLKSLDILAYQCGIEQSEFTKPDGWDERYAQAVKAIEECRKLEPDDPTGGETKIDGPDGRRR
jgi:hypothetical protein